MGLAEQGLALTMLEVLAALTVIARLAATEEMVVPRKWALELAGAAVLLPLFPVFPELTAC